MVAPHTGRLIPMLSPSYSKLPARFWSKVEPASNGCWVWTGSKSKGYGYIRYQGKMRLVHRLALIDFTGGMPAGMWALHHCDVRRCVTVSHLYWGTALENTGDRIRRGRSAVLAGETNGMAKLTTPEVLKIRQIYAAGRGTCRSLGRQFGVSKTQITHIVRREQWAHV